jgi:N-acetylneuraminic acid mutarotase
LYVFHILILSIFIIRVESFTPKERAVHSSALVGTKLYFFGGSVFNDFSSNEVFYLDVFQTFNFESPPWTDLTTSAKIPFGSEWGTVSLIDNNNNPIIYLYGGFMRDPVTNNSTLNTNVFTFDIKTSKWEIPIINSKAPERRAYINAAANNDTGKIYIFGGFANDLLDSTTEHFFNDTLILDTVNLIFSNGPTLNVPRSRIEYSATMLSNGVIVYIGGLESVGTTRQLVNMNQINLYDTNLDTWSLRVRINDIFGCSLI